MNAVGDGNDINTIRMRHHGMNFNFNKWESQCRPSHTGAPIERDRNLTLEFKDLNEVNILISALQEFTELCKSNMGRWERT